MPPWTLRFDGLYEPRYGDRGIGTYGFVAYHGDEKVHAQKGLVAAMIHALTWLAEGPRAPSCPVVVEGDNLTSARLLPLRDLARGLVERLGGATLTKISRGPTPIPTRSASKPTTRRWPRTPSGAARPRRSAYEGEPRSSRASLREAHTAP